MVITLVSDRRVVDIPLGADQVRLSAVIITIINTKAVREVLALQRTKSATSVLGSTVH
jgi:hypothetical protein